METVQVASQTFASEDDRILEEKYPTLLASKLVQRWIRKRRPNTRRLYLHLFQHFLSWTKTEIDVETPDELLEWANSQSDGLQIHQVIDDYADTCKPSIGQVTTACVRSFLDRNACRIRLPKIDWTPTMSFTEGYSRKDIQQLLQYLDDPLQKFYIMLGKDTGLRANDLLYLQYKHIREDLESSDEKKRKYPAIRFEPERYLRRKAPGRAFFGPNSVELLNKLIASGRVSRQPDKTIFPWIYSGITASIERARTKANINPEIQPSHGLRKFFEGCLDGAQPRLDIDKKRQIEGHSNGVRDAYTSQKIDELRDLYIRAYPLLDLSEEAAVEGELGKLQKQVADLTTQLEQSRARDKLWEDAFSSDPVVQLTARRKMMELFDMAEKERARQRTGEKKDGS